MAPSSLKGVQGFGIYTTRDIQQNEPLLQANVPDGPSIPVIDYHHYHPLFPHGEDDDQQDDDDDDDDTQ